MSSYYELSCGKKVAKISFDKGCEHITVCCKNASHAAWKGFGNSFGSFDDAVEKYKSEEMKTMIRLVEHIAGNQTNESLH